MSQPMREERSPASETAIVSPGRVVAWRRWRLCPDPAGLPLLASAHENRIWSGRTLSAECDPSRTWSYRLALGDDGFHEAPAPGCRCGIYAYSTPELACPMGPGIWAHGRVLMGGPMSLTDSGYRAREATIDGPLGLTIECVGGDDLYSPTRCFGSPVIVKHDATKYFPVCSKHHHAPVHLEVDGSGDIGAFLEAAAFLAVQLETFIAEPS